MAYPNSTPPVHATVEARSSKLTPAGSSTQWCYNCGEIGHPLEQVQEAYWMAQKVVADQRRAI